jgi:iron complex outermembrane receptor protein
VTIDMHSSRLAIEGELRDLSGPLQSIRAQASRSDYQHVELNAGTPGTVFKSEGQDLRLQARHTPWGRLSGVLGVQLEDNRFSADGQEAFAPYSRTGQTAVFVNESLALSWGQLNLGARLGSVQVASLGNPLLPRFVPATRNFTPGNYAVGVVWPVANSWQVNANVSLSERAPKDYELFANGVHVATRTYEIGSDKLAVERATNADVGLSWKQGAHSASVQAFVNQFSNFISLQATNMAAPVPEYTYTQVQARFVGLELNGQQRLLEGAQTLDLAWRWDRVQADDQTTGQPLPRIAPMRTGATLLWARGDLSARVGFDQLAAQDRVPQGQLAVDGYTLWHAAMTWRERLGKNELLWYARLDNAGDALAYSATSILTQTAPGKSPLPGRSLKLGLQLNF